MGRPADPDDRHPLSRAHRRLRQARRRRLSIGELKMPTASREVHLAKRPEGLPTLDDFALVETSLADPGEGEVLVRNLYMSVDPAMRPRMSIGQELNEAMGGGALGRVEKSRNPAFKEGELVTNR